MLRYISSILFLLLSVAAAAQVNTGKGKPVMTTTQRTDTTASDSVRTGVLPDSAGVRPVVKDSLRLDTTIGITDTTRPKMKDGKDSLGQIRLGFDISKILLQQVTQENLSSRRTYEFELDYYYKNELYFVAEAGWGNGSVNYHDLSYKSDNVFFKLGINKSLLQRAGPGDWGQAVLGIRYGLGLINRSDAYYETGNSFWGTLRGTIPGKSLTGHWFEITAGTRLEVYKGFFAGWNIRGKFRLNRKEFEELPPYFIAGYGKGDKNAVFDFNFYLAYAIRWER